MGYLELLDRYRRITMKIGFLETQSQHDDDNALTRQIKMLREEQKEVEEEIDQYNEVYNE